MGTALLGLAAGAGLWSHTHRRSAAARHWQESRLAWRRVGPLWCRVGGNGTRGALLLHGLIATGDVFGRIPDRLAESRVVAVPDLLGFGRSIDHNRHDFATEAHMAAIDAVVAEALGERPVVVVAHSMGCALALRWVAHHAERVEELLCIGAPMWAGSGDARLAIGRANPMAKAFALDEDVARWVCTLSCRYRTVSGWIAAAAAPRWPVPIARRASQHTWLAYRQALVEQVLEPDWPTLVGDVDRAGVRLRLIWGDEDTVGDRAYARSIAAGLENVSVDGVAGADHTLPCARPELIVEMVEQLGPPDALRDPPPVPLAPRR